MAEIVNIFIGNKDQNKFVAIKRSVHDKFFGGMLALPGGNVESTESHQQTAIRESLEELGVKITSIESKSCLQTTLDILGSNKSLYVYKAVLESYNFHPQDPDIESANWVKPDEFLNSLIEHGYPESEVQKMQLFLTEQGYH